MSVDNYNTKKPETACLSVQFWGFRIPLPGDARPVDAGDHGVPAFHELVGTGQIVTVPMNLQEKSHGR